MPECNLNNSTGPFLIAELHQEALHRSWMWHFGIFFNGVQGGAELMFGFSDLVAIFSDLGSSHKYSWFCDQHLNMQQVAVRASSSSVLSLPAVLLGACGVFGSCLQQEWFSCCPGWCVWPRGWGWVGKGPGDALVSQRGTHRQQEKGAAACNHPGDGLSLSLVSLTPLTSTKLIQATPCSLHAARAC